MRSREVKRGRNEPCPCGSGNKYKRCCLSTTPASLSRKEPISQELIQRSSERLKHRVRDNLGEQCILHEGEFKVKMSEIILDLADDILKIAETKSQYKNAIGITCMAWNLSILSGTKRENLLDGILNKMDEQARDDTLEIISAIIEKKKRYYAHINRLIVDYEVLGNKDNIHLNVMSVVSQDEIAATI